MMERLRQSGLNDDARERELLRFAGENMNEAQQEKMRSVLRDRRSLQELLQSEQAQALLRSLGKQGSQG